MPDRDPPPPPDYKVNGPVTIKDGKPFTEEQEEIDRQVTELIFGNVYDVLSATVDEIISTAIDTMVGLSDDVKYLASGRISGMLNFIGFGIDYAGMINDGVDKNKALVAAIIHVAVGFGAALLLAELGATGGLLVLGSLALSLFLNYSIDSIIKV